MKRWKSLSAIAVGVAAAVALAGCSGSGSASTSKSGSDKGTVAFSFPTQDVDIWNAQLKLMKPILKKSGYTLTTDNPNWNLQTQVNDWQSWIAGGKVKAIMGFPIQTDAFTPVAAKAKAAGIPVIGYSGTWPGVTYQLKLDSLGAGKAVGLAAGKWIAAKLGTSTPVPVGLLADSTSQLGQTQLEGLKEGLKESGANVKDFSLQAQSRDQAYKDAQSQLIAHPDTKVFLGISADMGLGARQAFIDKGVSATDPDHYIGATDVSNEVIPLIEKGDDMWKVSYVWSAKELAQADATLLIEAAEGKLKKNIVLGVQEVDQQNASQFLIK